MIRKLLPILALVAAAAMMCSCGDKKPVTNTTTGTATLFCDNSFQNIIEQEIEVYEYIYPKAHLLCRYGTETEAFDSLMSLNTRTIIAARDITSQERKTLESKKMRPRSEKIAVDAVALIINPENPATYLSLTEIEGILAGEITSWLDINPSYPDIPIKVVFDDARSSMVHYMTDSLLHGKQMGPGAFQAGSIPAVINAVQTQKGAIGVIGVSWLTSNLKHTATIDSISKDIDDETTSVDMGEINKRIDESGVKVLGVLSPEHARAFYPYQQNIYDGTYPLTRSIYMITTASTHNVASGFYAYVTSFRGQKLIMKTGVMPARMRIEIAEITTD